MDKIKLAEAVAAAKEFIGRAYEYERDTPKRMYGEYEAFEPNPKATGSIRRQSMELTRALAQLRKPA